MDRKTFLSELVEYFSSYEDIKAIALAGSLVTELTDESSDIDVYIYASSEVPASFRETFIQKHSSKYELNNQFWETGDEFIVDSLKTSVDIMYRCPNWIQEQIERVWHNKQASVGYSTCFLHNVATSQVLYDKSNWFKNLQEQLQGDYPEQLTKNIIAKNYPILRDNISAYKFQIEKALKRNDLVSVNHRVAVLLASYFDILFSINKVFHPGEKKLKQFVNKLCAVKPVNWEQQVYQVLRLNPKTLVHDIDALVDGLDSI